MSIFKKKIDLDEVAKDVLLNYLQNWGQSLEDRKNALNKGVEACGLKVFFDQNADGSNSGWFGEDKYRAKHAPLAKEFRARLQNCWTGSFETEVASIKALIREIQGHVDKE
jgi:hypothetical protein